MNSIFLGIKVVKDSTSLQQAIRSRWRKFSQDTRPDLASSPWGQGVFDRGSVDNQAFTAVACRYLSCKDDTTVDLIKIVFCNNLFGYLSITVKWCTGSQSCMTIQSYHNKKELCINRQNFLKCENPWELMIEIQDSEDFSLGGIGSFETYGDTICMNHLKIRAKGLGIAQWDPREHGHTASIIASSFFKIWDPKGRLPSAIMLWISIPSPIGLVHDRGCRFSLKKL